jgi:hypothetical protein
MARQIHEYTDFQTGEIIYQVPSRVKTHQFESLGAAKRFIASKKYRELNRPSGFGEKYLNSRIQAEAETLEALAKRKIVGKNYLK